MNLFALTGRLQATPELRGQDYKFCHFILEVRKQLPMVGSPFYDEISCEASSEVAERLATIPAEHDLLCQGYMVSRTLKNHTDLGHMTVLHVTSFRDLGHNPKSETEASLEKSRPFIDG